MRQQQQQRRSNKRSSKSRRSCQSGRQRLDGIQSIGLREKGRDWTTGGSTTKIGATAGPTMGARRVFRQISWPQKAPTPGTAGGKGGGGEAGGGYGGRRGSPSGMAGEGDGGGGGAGAGGGYGDVTGGGGDGGGGGALGNGGMVPKLNATEAFSEPTLVTSRSLPTCDSGTMTKTKRTNINGAQQSTATK